MGQVKETKSASVIPEHRMLSVWLNSAAYRDLRDALQRSIQYPKLEIDRKCFKKTLEDKANAKIIKEDWKKEMKKFYGENWRKFNNTPEVLAN